MIFYRLFTDLAFLFEVPRLTERLRSISANIADLLDQPLLFLGMLQTLAILFDMLVLILAPIVLVSSLLPN